MSTGFIIAMIAAAVVLMLGMLVLQFVTKNEKKDERLKQMMEKEDATEQDENFVESLRSETDASSSTVMISDILSFVGIDMEKFRKKHQLKFYRAGLHSPDAPVLYFLYTRVISVLIVGFGIMWGTKKDAQLVDYLIAFVIVVVGAFGANLYIKNKTEKRAKALTNSFPDVLDLLLACVESGLALDGALLRVCKELATAHPLITEELNRLRVELSLLNDRTQALNNFSERNGLLSFRLFVTALLQSEKFGTSLTDTLRVMSEDYRTQRLMRAEEKAGRLPAMITIPLIIFLLPALFLLILSPAAITSIANLNGK